MTITLMPHTNPTAKHTGHHVALVSKSVHVPVEPARALQGFIAHIADLRNRATTAGPTKVPIDRVVLDTRTGGRWYQCSADGSECEWATVIECIEPTRLLLNWRVAGQPTELEIRCDGPAPRRTDLTIIHRGFEVFGDYAERMRSMHEMIWDDVLRHVADEVEGNTKTANRLPEHGSIPRSVTDGRTVLATMDMTSSPERIFRAITTKETEHWWGAPDTYRATKFESDLRVDGEWSVAIRLNDGKEFPASGRYLEVEAPHRIVQTRRYDWDYPEFGRQETTVTYLLEPIATGARVTVRQDGFAGFRNAADHHATGWENYLHYLSDYVGAESRRGP